MPHKIKPVKIVHPQAGESTVDEPSLPHWERAGWKRKDAADLKKSAPTKKEG